MICTLSPLPILPAHQTPLLTPFLGEGTPSVHPWSSQCHLLELGPRSHRSLQRQHHNGEVGGVGLARVCDHQPRPSWASQVLGVHQGRAGSAETLIWLLETQPSFWEHHEVGWLAEKWLCRPVCAQLEPRAAQAPAAAADGGSRSSSWAACTAQLFPGGPALHACAECTSLPHCQPTRNHKIMVIKAPGLS